MLGAGLGALGAGPKPIYIYDERVSVFFKEILGFLSLLATRRDSGLG
jgi:hypothetical protein